MEFLDRTFLENSLKQYAIAIGITVLVYAGLRLIRSLVERRLSQMARLTATKVDDLAIDVLKSTKVFFLLVVALYAGTHAIQLPERVSSIARLVVIIAALLQGGIWATTALASLLSGMKQQAEDDRARAARVTVLGIFLRVIVWSVVLLLVLDNLGVDVTALVAGLGIGGVAVALALQTILGDLFASLSIMIDKPFLVGDFLIVDEFLGTVDQIGLKTTRMRSLSGEQLIFSNSDLLKARIRNYGRMFERRVAFTLGVTYQTPREMLKQIPALIRDVVERQEKTRFDRSHFKEYGPYSLNFETVFYVLAADYNTYMDIQQAINLEIHERFEALGIEFAFPTQTLFLASDSPVGVRVEGAETAPVDPGRRRPASG